MGSYISIEEEYYCIDPRFEFSLNSNKIR